MKVPKKELELRKKRLQTELKESCVEALLLTHPVDIQYFTGNNLYDYLFVPAEGAPLPFFQYTKAHLNYWSLDAGAGVQSIEEIPMCIKEFYGEVPQIIGFQLDVLPISSFRHLKKVLHPKKVINGSDFVLAVRKIKSKWELEQMQEVAGMSSEVFEYLAGILRPGITEMELAAEAEAYFQKIAQTQIKIRVRHYLTEGYPWHVLSGSCGGMVGVLDSPASGAGTSPAFPCGASMKLICKDEPIMVDFACEFNGYHMDETRIFVIGSLSKEIDRACKAAIEIHNSVLDSVKPGLIVGELFDFSVKKADSLGYTSYYLGPQNQKVSFVGHGIGCELIEEPILARGRKEELLPGMVFALEPKLVSKDRFIAGIESVFTVTETGYSMISKVPVKIFRL